MKILKNTKEHKPVFPVEIKCTHCKSIMEVERDDCKLGTLGFYIVECPVCGKVVEIEDGYEVLNHEIADMYFENLTVDTIHYPDTFYHFKNGAEIENDKINEWLRIAASNLANGSELSYTGSGDTFVIGFKVNNGYEWDDDEFHVLKDSMVSFDKHGNIYIVSKDNSDCEIFGGEV